MDRREFKEMARTSPSHQATINSMVGELIATRGYQSVIDELVAAVYSYGEISLADPENHVKLRDFDAWAQAVRAAILEHYGETAFESRLTNFDHRLAEDMGISLD